MKKILIAASLTIVLFSCRKDTVKQEPKEEVFIFRIQGKVNTSQEIAVRM